MYNVDLVSWTNANKLMIKSNHFPLYLGYVDSMKKILFTLPKSEMKEVFHKYSTKAPAPLNNQFPDRLKKDVAVTDYKERTQQRQKTPLFPPSKYSMML